MKKVITHFQNKLVRDNIISIILKKEGQADFRKLSSEELGPALISKIKEEIGEFEKDKTLEELADIYTVWEALVSSYGFCMNEVMNIVSEKKSINGGFSEGIFLESYTEVIHTDDEPNDAEYEAAKSKSVNSLVEMLKSEKTDKFYKSERMI